MKTMNVREFRNAVPHLRETLANEHELVLISHGEPIARILPMEPPPQLQSLKWLRDQSGSSPLDSTAMIREDRDRRGT
jgi:antitoxin (DNA-binding transcriptional repressor) of toxin-antitoxin stability system